MDFWHDAFESTLEANKNWGRWFNILAVMLTEIISWEIVLENILSMRVFEWLLILVGYNIYDIKELKARESKNSFVGWWSLKFSRLILKSPRRKTHFSLVNLSRMVLTKFLLESEPSILGCL